MHHWTGIVGFMSPFLKNCSIKLEVLHEYIHSRPVKRDGRFVHLPPDEPVKKAFEEIKELLCGDLVLRRPDFKKQFILEVDASVIYVGCGCILSQEDDEGNYRPTAYWSVRWVDATKHWAPVEHECLAFRKSVEHFHEYLCWQKFIAIVDSEPLQWLNTIKKPRGKMAEWILEMQQLEFEVRHRSGRYHTGPDGFSRLGLQEGRISDVETRSMHHRDFPDNIIISSVDLLQKPASGVKRWKDKMISCVLTDGESVLVVESLSNSACLFPSGYKRSEKEELRFVLIRIILEAFHFDPGSVSLGHGLDAILGGVHKVKTRLEVKGDESCTHVVVSCAIGQLLQFMGCSYTEELKEFGISWVPIDVALKGFLSEENLSVASNIRSYLLHTEKAFPSPVTTFDGRLMPLAPIDDASGAYVALRQLNFHMSKVKGTNDNFMVFDFEYDINPYGVDLIQVAAGPLIFVFDTLCFPDVLTELVMHHPSLSHDVNFGGFADILAVPTLRYWLSAATDVVKSVQASTTQSP